MRPYDLAGRSCDSHIGDNVIMERETIPQWFLAIVTIGITLQLACMGVLINIQIRQNDRLSQHIENHPNHAIETAIALLQQSLKTHTHKSVNSSQTSLNAGD